MAGLIFDLAVVALLVIGTTAFNGVFTNLIGEKLFGGKHYSETSDHSERIQQNWKQVGGKKS